MQEVGQWRVPGLVGVVETARLVMIGRLPERAMVGYIPDDAFYYLVMGRNFARLGRWTFDGVAPATGFHLAWGYLLAAVYAVAPGIGLHALFLVAGVFQIACLTTAVWLVGRTARRWFGVGAEIGVAVVFLSTIPLGVAIDMMEMALILVAVAATVDLLCRTETGDSRGMLVWAAALGFAGMMARSDYGALPFCLLAMQIVMVRMGLSSGAMVRRAGAVSAGAVAGLGFIAWHTHLISGQWMQGSARMKLLWSHSMGFSMVPAERLLQDVLSVVANTHFHSAWVLQAESRLVWVLPLVLAFGAVMTFRKQAAGGRVVLIGMVGVLAAYTVLYGFNRGDVQDWYLANLEVPMAVLAAAAASWFWRRGRVVTIVAATALCVYGSAMSFREGAPWQAMLYDGGMYLRTHPTDKPAGAWNAGIVGYFADGGVTNLDGLVNDDILPHVKDGSLADYVKARGLRSIVDYAVMWKPPYSDRGGYADGKLERCAVVDMVLNPPQGAFDDYNPVWLYRLKPEC